MTALLHLGLFLVLLSTSGRFDGLHEGETSLTQLLLLESPQAKRQDGSDTPPRMPDTPELQPVEPLPATGSQPPAAVEVPAETLDSSALSAAAPVESDTSTEDESTAIAIATPATFLSAEAEKAALIKNLARLAEQLTHAPAAQISWEQEGRLYHAALALQPASSGIDFDHVIADVSAESGGRQFKTQIRLKRLAFSHYTQMIDRWDPMVQLHDDEIIGRFHVNSRFNLQYDRRTVPVFLGKVTTAASSFSTEASGRRRESDIFRGGIETRAGRIELPEQLQPFDWAPPDEKPRIHELGNDTRIRFFADGSYSWRDRNTDAPGYVNQPTLQPVYFIAVHGARLYVQGVVSGRVLVYSPQGIVIESNLTYAHDPRRTPDSTDYLGLVSDRYIEVAAPHVTGPGDIEIHGALFAGRRFVVRDIDLGRPATLRILGSLTAGSVSASEPRYAMRIEYDSRFERQRPPGFPSTNRFAAEDWDGQWREAADATVADQL
ncbi:MAG TPA: hypothetical protein PKE27_06085 [Povalibacter sp.]|uniref:hypothetical protein n=1 Tax=Povalibacter sp. TaxID=1962978 RepID=UPI002BE7C9AB|nr:hypothetical protein [Povalibacter sp.]HMN44117.1 hypothetical protein [Povalibacter sp.]